MSPPLLSLPNEVLVVLFRLGAAGKPQLWRSPKGALSFLERQAERKPSNTARPGPDFLTTWKFVVPPGTCLYILCDHFCWPQEAASR